MSRLIDADSLEEALNFTFNSLKESEDSRDQKFIELTSAVVDCFKKCIDICPTTVCHCDMKENAEIICKIMDYDIDNEVAPVARKGHWVLEDNGNDYNNPGWKCSECGYLNPCIPPYLFNEDGDEISVEPLSFSGSNFCGNCGVCMNMRREGK